jgi:hypothetical protein
MTHQVERERNLLDEFAAAPQAQAVTVSADATRIPAESRPVGAQQVAVRRDESDVLRKLRILAASAGEDWYYRFPVQRRNADGSRSTEWVEGPSIKCAMNVARLYGNCEIDVRVFDMGEHWIYYARFTDIETGFTLTRPFSQRKSQKVMRTDAARAEDIVFQIGASKAIRNVINNALEFFTTFAAEEAKGAIVDRVGKRIDHYRSRVLERLAEVRIDVRRVERVRGRAYKDWVADDIARTIAELQAIQDGMATADETFPELDGVDDVVDDAAENESDVERESAASSSDVDVDDIPAFLDRR